MSDGSKEQPHMTAGLDLGDKYSYLCKPRHKPCDT